MLKIQLVQLEKEKCCNCGRRTYLSVKFTRHVISKVLEMLRETEFEPSHNVVWDYLIANLRCVRCELKATSCECPKLEIEKRKPLTPEEFFKGIEFIDRILEDEDNSSSENQD